MNKKKVVLSCEKLKKTYRDGDTDIEVLKGIDLTIDSGEAVAVLGVSGSGKSTLMHLLAGLDTPSSGTIYFNDTLLSSLSDKALTKVRNLGMGFIYQMHHLLSEFTVLENVAMPLLLSNMSYDDAIEKASKLVKQVGLSHRGSHCPSALSGGERQRVAIARALVNSPKCVFADEPTGNLDQKTAQSVFELLLTLNQEEDLSLIVVTHDQKLAGLLKRVVCLENGFLKKM